MIEDTESEIGENDKCGEVIDSFSQGDIAEADTIHIYIEAWQFL